MQTLYKRLIKPHKESFRKQCDLIFDKDVLDKIEKYEWFKCVLI